MNRLLSYLNATKGELKHVSWPTQKQTIIYTLLVIALSIITAGYLGLLDVLLGRILAIII